MTAERIAKLRELADKGIDGERDNARTILEKAGIDWRKPKETIIDSIKKKVGADITKEYSLVIGKASDIINICAILKLLKIKNQTVNIRFNEVVFKCTPAESKEISKIFFKNRVSFERQIFDYAYTQVDLK